LEGWKVGNRQLAIGNWPNTWPLAVIVVLPLLLFWRLLWGGEVLFWGLPQLQFHPWWTLARELITSGQMPLWNLYLGNGTPLLANHQVAVFYPPNLLYLLFPVERAMGYSVVLHVILAGMFMYAFTRTLGLRPWAGLIGSLSYMFSGYLIAHTGFLSMIAAFPWLALLFAAAERLIQRPTTRSVLLLALAVALQALAGHAQTWFYSLVAVSIYTLWRGYKSANRKSANHKLRDTEHATRNYHVLRFTFHVSGFIAFSSALALGIGLAAVQLLPTLEFSRLSQRAGGVSWDWAMTYSLWPWRLITLLLPDFFGNPARGDFWGYATYWEDCGYVGVFPFILAVMAVWTWVKKRGKAQIANCKSQIAIGNLRFAICDLECVPFFAVLAFFSLWLALGKNTFLYPLVFRYVPGFGLFQAPARLLSVYTLAVATLAAIGAETLRPWEWSERVAVVCRLSVAGGVAMGLAAWAAGRAIPGIKPTFSEAVVHFAVLLVLSLLLLLWGRNTQYATRNTSHASRFTFHVSCFTFHVSCFMFHVSRFTFYAWRLALLILVAADLAWFAYPLNPTTSPRLYTIPLSSAHFLRSQGDEARIFVFAADERELVYRRYLRFGDFGPRDADHWLRFRETLMPNQALPECIPSANNFDPLQVGRWRELIDEINTAPLSRALRLLRVMGVQYIIAPRPIPGLELAYQGPEVGLYRLPDPLPRAYFVSQARAIADPTALLRELAAPSFNPRQEVLLDKWQIADCKLQIANSKSQIGNPQSAIGNRQSTIGNPQSIALLRQEANRFTIQALIPQDGYLVLNDTWYPGWRVWVDGEEREVLRANYAFRAVRLEEGAHEVDFRYEPVSFHAGAAISGVAIVISFFLALRSR